MEKTNLPDIKTLKEILIHSKLASSYKRNNLLSNIGLNNNFAEKNIDNYTDADFVEDLINFLENTQQIEILIKLCQKIESVITTGRYSICLRAIKKRMEVFNIVIVNFEYNQELFYQSYKLALLRRDIRIPSNSNPIESIENLDTNEIIKNINRLDSYKDENFSLLDYFVGYLKLNLKQQNSDFFQQLDRWIKNYNNNLIHAIYQRADIKNRQLENQNSCLLISIDDGNNLIINAWFMEDTNKFQPINSILPDELIKGLTWKNLEQKFHQLLEFLLYSIKDKKLEIKNIQLLLPYKYVIPVDTFLIEREEEQYYLGAYYQISFRFLERIKPTTSIQEKDIKYRWVKKCNLLKEKIQQGNLKNIFKQLEISQSRKALLNEFRENELAAKLICAIEDSVKVQDILYFTGIPLALWVRKNLNNYKTELDNIICEASCLTTLSELVKTSRIEADVQRQPDNNFHVGNYLSFLWDDAELIPLEDKYEHQLLMP
ncbi:hypothetical protein [Nostoc sp. FACHB-145]|uniref:VMAP-C domain-containing protein n=1 Tax=Nostoc sp. FACHB-145 TaxID=2692836 RepID=UPI001682E00F|nr:hypothetical protein [Nostoc sp. FACHB-145]MBD2472674.1 hypothetical protein [Nostoc sp. FACHB-145]